MPPHAHRPAELAWQVFRGSDAIRRELLTRHQLRGASWVRLRQDVYADARLDRDHQLACRAALLLLPPGALIAGPSAAHLHGVRHAAGFDDDVHVLVPRAARVDSQPRLRVHHVGPDLPPVPHPAVPLDPLPPTSGDPPPDPRPHALAGRQPVTPRTGPAECAWETAVWADPVRAVGIVDTLLGSGLTSRDALAEVADRNAGRPGGRRAGWVFGLVDPAAQSAPESHLRVRLVLAGLPRPVVRHPVRLPSGVVLHPDLAWPEFRVAVEYDGHRHADADQLHRDRMRLDGLVGAGWLVLHVTSRRVHRDFPALTREVRAALDSRGWRP